MGWQELIVRGKCDAVQVVPFVNALALRGLCLLLLGVVEVDISADLGGGRHQQGGVEQVAIAVLAVRRIRRARIHVGAPCVFGFGERVVDADGGAAGVVGDVVPAIHNLRADGVNLVDRHGGAPAEVPVGNGPGKQKPARICPVVLGFNDLSAGEGDELAAVDLQPLPLGGLDAQEGLLDVFELAGGVDQAIGTAVNRIYMRANRGGVVIQRELGCAQAWLVGVLVEVIVIIHLAVVCFCRVVMVVGVITI